MMQKKKRKRRTNTHTHTHTHTHTCTDRSCKDESGIWSTTGVEKKMVRESELPKTKRMFDGISRRPEDCEGCTKRATRSTTKRGQRERERGNKTTEAGGERAFV